MSSALPQLDKTTQSNPIPTKNNIKIALKNINKNSINTFLFGKTSTMCYN